MIENKTMKNSTSNGIGFSSMLTIVFIVLKLTDNIDWSWWWVVSPLWISWLVILGILIVIGIIALVCD